MESILKSSCHSYGKVHEIQLLRFNSVESLVSHRSNRRFEIPLPVKKNSRATILNQ